ncbi:transposase [Carboxylicivirga sp. N1Y90]|uniref:transposase n=1 Tax=Carboxylicivirga fragile TaxID=3417571 RepID=UPI003D353A5B|nr:transposase [Marinilabiliaceae bacterium N1Y90]
MVADRAYVDFENLYRWHKGNSYFVVRLKKSVKLKHLVEQDLPESRHQINQQNIQLITNQFTWTANTISDLYKARWEIEQF